MAEMPSKEELIDIINDLSATLASVRNQLLDAQADLKWFQDKLIEAQERNRKLDWALTQTVEELR